MHNICNYTHIECQNDGRECEQVRQQHVIHRQLDQRVQGVEECSYDLIKCHGCTELMSAIGRMIKDIEVTPSLWPMAGYTSQPVARPVRCRRLTLVFPCLRWYWIRQEQKTHVQPQLFFACRLFSLTSCDGWNRMQVWTSGWTTG